MPEWAMFIGSFARWVFKGCQTILKDAIEGNLEAIWGGTYDTENYIIGIITVVVMLGLVIWLVV